MANARSSLKRRSPALPLLAILLALALSLAGCGGGQGDRDRAAAPRAVPPGAIAVVARTPITRAEVRRWLPIAGGGEGVRPSARRRRALAYLIEAQWALQEAQREGVNGSVLDQLVARRVAGGDPSSHTETPAQRAFSARVEIVAAALRRRHGRVGGPIGNAAIPRYYAAHGAAYAAPAVRRVRMIVTRARAAARRARAALRRGGAWGKVAKRFSTYPFKPDSAIDLAAHGEPHQLVHAAFATPPPRLIGPLRVDPPVGDRTPLFYLLQVIGDRSAGPRPLREVRAQVRNRLRERRGIAALAAFERSFRRRWRKRTVCAPAYRVSACGNHRALDR